jgi:alpha-L-fucosidase
MKPAVFLIILGITLLVCNACKINPKNASFSDEASCAKFEETWESLATANVTPDWFLDAKFGIYTHWGPVSNAFINMDEKERLAGWHGMRMYQTETNNYKHHVEQYGDPAVFGYKELIQKFSPSGFDPQEWAALFAESGAKFAGPVAMHHDNFAMWNSKTTRWNSMNYGGLDVAGELKKAIETKGMKYMGSFHHAFTWKYYAPAHAYTEIDPEDYDLFTEPHHIDSLKVTQRFLDEWWAKLKEFIDVYQPDLLWFDWWLENLPESERQKFLAYYYNKGKEWGKDVAVCFKETTFPEEVAIRDYERGRPNQPKKQGWLTDTSPGAWFYRSNAEFVTPNELIDILVDIVAKNGCMLLNVPPNPDGTIPQEMKVLLAEIGDWLDVNGEAIYATRPWTIFGEGPTRIPSGGHKIEKTKIEYGNSDIRFTKKSNTEFFAIVMDKPESEIRINTLSTLIGALNNPIENIELLGSSEIIHWERNEKGLVIKAPKILPTSYSHCFKITLQGYQEQGIGGEDG